MTENSDMERQVYNGIMRMNEALYLESVMTADSRLESILWVLYAAYKGIPLRSKSDSDLDFLSTLIDLIDSIKNLELNVFDIGNLVNMTGNMNYYNDNFIENFNNILTQSSDYKVNIFIGIGLYQNVLTIEESQMLEKIQVTRERFCAKLEYGKEGRRIRRSAASLHDKRHNERHFA